MSSTYDKILQYKTGLPGSYSHVASCIDMHTGGEPLRVVLRGGPPLKGGTILDQRRQMIEHHDAFRKRLMWEPRGHADMYGILLVPPERPGADFGVLFMHNEGYSTMCGHATIAIAKLAVLMGWVEKREPVTEIKIDAPCGPLSAYAGIRNGEIHSIYFDNVPSFVQLSNAETVLPGGQKIVFDLAYGGAFYAYVDIQQFGMNLQPENYAEIIKLGRLIKEHVGRQHRMLHPFEPGLNFLYGTIFTEPPDSPGYHSRNVCVFADGEVDRSATGSGVSGRAAIHYVRKELPLNEPITIKSIVGSAMEVEVLKELDYGPYKAVVPRVYGDAWISGTSEFYIDRDDPFQTGFFLR